MFSRFFSLPSAFLPFSHLFRIVVYPACIQSVIYLQQNVNRKTVQCSALGICEFECDIIDMFECTVYSLPSHLTVCLMFNTEKMFAVKRIVFLVFSFFFPFGCEQIGNGDFNFTLHKWQFCIASIQFSSSLFWITRAPTKLFY